MSSAEHEPVDKIRIRCQNETGRAGHVAPVTAVGRKDVILRISIVLAFSALLTACVSVSTSEIQLSRNVWQIQAGSQGDFVQGETANALFKRAAELTLEKGYTHFVLGVPRTNSTISTGAFTPVSANVVGDSVFVTGGQPINFYRETSTVVVKMSRSEAGGALDAAAALASIK